MKSTLLNETRLDLAKLFKGTGVEVGVANGWYSRLILDTNPETKLYGVDPYIPHRGYMDYTRPDTYTRMYGRMMERLGNKSNFTHIRAFSMDAVNQFTDGSLDFVYIDADHSYQAVTDDITAWIKKVKPGGILAGDDYIRSHRDTKYYDVIHAVNDYVANNNIPELFIYAAGRTPSNWMFRR